MLAELGDRLLTRWGRSTVGVPAPRSLRYVGVTGRVEGATTTLLAFGDDARRPLLAVKIHRDRDAGERVRAEAELLARLARIPDVSRSVPRVVLADRVAGSWVLVQTALEGRPMAGRSGALDRETALALAWLQRLHGGDRAGDADGLRASVGRAFGELRRTFDLAPRESDYVGSIDVELAIACGAFLEHGDFAPHNVLVGREGIGVVDWTDGRASGAALHDALFFVTTVSVLRAWSGGGVEGLMAAFARAYLDEGVTREGIRDLLRRHAAALGVDRGALDALFGIFLVTVSVAEATRLRRAHARGSWPQFALQVAAAERLGPDRIVEAQPWIRFLRVVAARGGTSLG